MGFTTIEIKQENGLDVMIGAETAKEALESLLKEMWLIWRIAVNAYENQEVSNKGGNE